MRSPTLSQLTQTLPPLLSHLAKASPAKPARWEGWRITPILGGANNLVYRTQQNALDLAVKFTIRDARRRAYREYNALFALQHGGYHLAPKPLWLDETSYAQPVVVQQWLTGKQLDGPPRSPMAWRLLIDHYAQIQSVTQAHCMLPISDAVLMFKNGNNGKTAVFQAAKALPDDARPPEMQQGLRWLENWTPPSFPTPPLALCRNDANWRNLITQNGRCLSVDWENSGWGDPAFEIADLITHPAYDTIPDDQWPQVVQLYASVTRDKTAVLRISTYTRLMLIWWLIRWSRYLYEIPRELDQRLVNRPPNWQARTRRKLAQTAAKLDTMTRLLPT